MNVLYGDLTSVNSLNDLIQRVEALEAQIKLKQDIIDQYVSKVDSTVAKVTFTIQKKDGTTETVVYPKEEA